MAIRVLTQSLVVLVGPSGAGKSVWAKRWFPHSQVVASDDLRAVVGEDSSDQAAGTDAFEVLDLVVARRLKRGLLTVVDTVGLDEARTANWLELARKHQRPTHMVVFDTEPKVCRSRNRSRPRPVPAAVLTSQLSKFAELRDDMGADFDSVDVADDVVVVPTVFATAVVDGERQREAPIRLSFGLQVSRFDWPGENDDIATRLADIAVEAEDAGFESLWVMDHLIQIPQVGREWEPMLESYTTLGYLAGRTSAIRLGALVSAITYRSVAHLAKIVATLDVLSGGRAMCGIGAAWFEREHQLYGYEFGDLARRFGLLEDALQLLPLMWGPGSPAFEGELLSTAEAICYPRPVQDHIPILVGGSGENRTLRLVAQYADACNLFGDPDTVRHKIEVLHQHCADQDRDAAAVEVTHLSTAMCAAGRDGLRAAIERRRPARVSPEEFAASVNAGTPEDHIGRYRQLAEAGVQTAIVSIADVGDPGSVLAFGDVITEFDG